MRRRVGTAVVLALLLGSVAPGPVPSFAQRADHEAELDRLRGEIRRLRGRLQNVRKQTRTVESDLQTIDLELQILARELDAILSVERQLVSQRREIADRVVALEEGIRRHERYLSKRLAALYRMGRVPYLRLLLSMDPRADPLRGASMLAYLVGRDARAVSAFQRSQERLVIEEGRLAEKEAQIVRTRQAARERQAAVASKRKEKAALLAKLRSESRRSAAELAELEEKARRLERLFELLYRENTSAGRAAPITEFKGALGWPVRGEVIEEFGRQRSTRFNTYVINNGIRIAADPGTPVRALFSGTVLFAQWFKGYGNLIILDHGDRVFSLYGNTRGSTLAVGDRVDAGATIALVAEDEEGDSGYLYFEVREDNRPADPRTWLR
ncbi:MAG: murein hydrolase activator EnvC family protein [Thermoanaerobaculia bacterium]